MKSIDLSALKVQIDLLALTSAHTHLHRVAASGGGEWAGACPFCGGVDRFRVQPYARPEPRWLCRHCTDGKWQDAIAFGQRLYPNLSFREVCERLSGGRLTLRPAQPRPQPLIQPAYAPPPPEWQQQARQVIERGQEALWGRAGHNARRYLNRRGLSDSTLQVWKLGYSTGFQVGGMRIPREMQRFSVRFHSRGSSARVTGWAPVAQSRIRLCAAQAMPNQMSAATQHSA